MSEIASLRPQRLRTREDLLKWRDHIVLQAAAHMDRSEIEQAEAWLRELEQATTDAWTLEMTDRHARPIARGRKIIATFDPARRPGADEVVIIYGSYPHMYGNVVVNNPVRRHVSDFWRFGHDAVEWDPRWRGVDQIYVVNMDQRVDRYDSVLLELASAKAPLDRLSRISAIPAESCEDRQLGGAIACLQSHIQALRRAQAERHQNVLILEDDFCFTTDVDQHLTDLATFLSRGYDYWITLIATSKYGVILPKDDLVSFSFQQVTNTAAHLLSQAGISTLLPVLEYALECLQRTGDCSRYAADRCWSVLQSSGKFLVFRRKFGFQAASFSNIEGAVSRYLD